ncbi:MAG: CmcI family methyltransferase [Bryobacterales bacterium]|nr:CmcI family methyltransferase [Bryobacterales bacterium]
MNKHASALVCCTVVLSAVVGPACGAQEPAKAGTPASARPKVYELQVADRLSRDRLLYGFYDGTEGWKWTARKFAVSIDAPPPLDAPTYLDLDFNVPSELIDEVHEVTLTVRVNGSQVAVKKYSAAGREYPRFEVPPALLKRSPAVVECELDRWGKDRATGRDVGLIVVGVKLAHPDSTLIGHDAATELARQGYLRLLEMRQLQLPRDRQNEMMKLFHDIPVWQHMWFQNVQIDKNPLDLWMMQQLIYELQPEFIVETGTAMGGSALYWAHTLNGMGLVNSRVLTVDINELPVTAPAHPLWKKYVTFFRGSSTDPAIVAQIGQRVRGRKTLVTLDSDHSMKHVLDELHVYAPMVSRGSYLIVEDTHIDGIPTQPGAGAGPMAAVLRFLREENAGQAFEQDFSREAYIMTFNPGGWLRRK